MANAVLMPYPRFRAFDANGDPLAGGKVYFYEAGTTTPKDTYTDADAGTPNTNPVILDAQGYADIWGSGSYYIEIYTSTNVLISSHDDFDVNLAVVKDGTSGVIISGGGSGNNSITSSGVIVGGADNTITGTGGAIVGGSQNTISGLNGVIIGGNSNSVTGSRGSARGYQAASTLFCEHSSAIGYFSTAGDAQYSDLCFKGTTTNATPTEIFIDGSAARLTIPTDCTYGFEALIVARRTDVDGESAFYQCLGCIDNNAGTTALVGSVTKNVIAEDTAGWDVAFTADNTNDALALTVTGAAASTVYWFGKITIIKIKG